MLDKKFEEFEADDYEVPGVDEPTCNYLGCAFMCIYCYYYCFTCIISIHMEQKRCS